MWRIETGGAAEMSTENILDGVVFPSLHQVIAQQVAAITPPDTGCDLDTWQRAVAGLGEYPALAFAVQYALGSLCATPNGRAPAVLSLCGGSGRCKTAVARMGILAAGGRELNGVTATASSLDTALKRNAPVLVDEVSALSPDLLARLIHAASNRAWPVLLTTTAPVADRLKGGLREALRWRLLELHIGDAPPQSLAIALHTASHPSAAVVKYLRRQCDAAESQGCATTVFDELIESSGFGAVDGYILWGIGCAHAAAERLKLPKPGDLTAWAANEYQQGGIESATEHVARAFSEDLHRNRHAICYWPNKRKHKATCAAASPYARDYGNGVIALPVDTVHGILQREGLTIAALRAWAGTALREGSKVRLLPNRQPERVFVIDRRSGRFDTKGET